MKLSGELRIKLYEDPQFLSPHLHAVTDGVEFSNLPHYHLHVSLVGGLVSVLPEDKSLL